jgi:hypothetical protein
MDDDKRLNEVIRVKKLHSNFVIMDKGFLENPDLSWKAKGILAYLLSKPDNWKVIVKDIVNHAKEGKTAVYSGLNELKEAGYYVKRPIRDDKGHFIKWESIVYESPLILQMEEDKPEQTRLESASHPLPENPEMDNPEMDNPVMENRERNNNYINNNNCTKNHVSQVRQVSTSATQTKDKDKDGTDETGTDLIERVNKIREKASKNAVPGAAPIPASEPPPEHYRLDIPASNAPNPSPPERASPPGIATERAVFAGRPPYAEHSRASPCHEVPDSEKTDDTEERIEACMALIMENIDYESLAMSRQYDMNLVNEFIAVMLDSFFTTDNSVRISGEPKPRALVNSTLKKLRYEHIEHCIDQFKNVTERITKKKPYMLSMLYNSMLEVDAHYINMYHADRFDNWSTGTG